MLDEEEPLAGEMPTGIPPTPVSPANSPFPTPIPRRPVEVTVIGILLLGYGCLQLVQFILMAILFARIGMDAYTIPAVPMFGFAAFWFVITMLTSIASVIAGIGLLKLHPAARKGTLYLCWAFVGLVIITTLLTYTLVNPIWEMNLQVSIVDLILIAWRILFATGVNGLFIYFLTRPKVVEAFERHAE